MKDLIITTTTTTSESRAKPTHDTRPDMENVFYQGERWVSSVFPLSAHSIPLFSRSSISTTLSSKPSSVYTLNIYTITTQHRLDAATGMKHIRNHAKANPPRQQSFVVSSAAHHHLLLLPALPRLTLPRL
ncbi:hypothetical protein E2C01_056590 [Portunus trituberculatus]|uniref:Uncharacterized protein n=1 Tax=Portunus trituberculatus TaxID=210409 RepID=A0A5B7GYN1_PORTR|nr:hypothetical protein [Portunus trituberculatus]